MNSDNQTILHIKAGHKAPTEMLQYILNKKPNAVGFMVQEPNGAPLQVMQEDATNLDLATVENFLTEAEARPKSMYFGKLADGYNPEDIQPVTIEDPDNNVLLGIMFEGDVSTVFEDKTHTEHHQYLHTILIPKVVSWFEAFDGDVKEVMKQFDRESFKKTLQASIGHRAVLHIMPNVGDVYMHGKNQLFKPFDWGWASHCEGFGVKAATTETTVKKPAVGYGWGGNKTPAKANADKPTLSVVKDAATPGTAPRASVPEARSTPRRGEGTPIAETMAVRPPSWLHKNDDIKAFYEVLTGEVHSAWKKRVPIIPSQNHDLLKVANEKDFQDYTKKWKMERALKPTGATVTKQERLASTATPGATPDITLPAEPPQELPILNPKDIEKVVDFIAKYLDGSSKEMEDPTTIQEVEKKLAPFTEQVGLKGLEETMNWPVSGLFGLAATDARAVVTLLVQWRNYARPYLLAELKAKKKDNVQMTTETKTTVTEGGAKKTESVVKPAAKKATYGWGGNKKVA